MKVQIFTPLSLLMAVLGSLSGGMMLYYGWHHSEATDPALLAHANRQFAAGWKIFLGSVSLGVLAEISLALNRVR